MGDKKDKRDADDREQSSKLVLCKNPETGEWVVKCEGSCPVGYIEEAYNDLQEQKELVFEIPRVKKRYVEVEEK